MRLQDTFLKQLTDAPGISGNEHQIRDIITKAIQDHVQELRVDSLGNLITLKKGTGESNLRVMIAAHMDEVGFMVTGFDSDGGLKFKTVGGVEALILPSQRVKIGPKGIAGVINWKPIHKSYMEKSVQKMDNLRIDIGVDSKSAAQGKVKLGDSVVFATETIELSETTLRGKAFDDRAGCAQMIEHIKGDPFPFDVYFVFTVQEEVGLRGARVMGESLRPDVAIILESTACHEIPQAKDEPDITTITKLGQGPAISYMDRTSIAHPGLLKHFVATAEANNIPHQFRSPQYAGGTDAGALQTSIDGVATLGISLPCRYLHSPYSIIHLNDFENSLRLVRQALMTLSPNHLER